MASLDLDLVQQRRKQVLRVVGASLFVMCLTFGPTWSEQSLIENSVETLGLLMIFLGVFGRAWCSLYIGGRKKRELVAVGPYSISRNPLYVFTYIATFGVGAQSGSILVACIMLVATMAIFRAVVAKEEAFLLGQFGEAYSAYMKRTPRFLPRLSSWQDQSTVEVRPGRVVRTLLDGSMFLLAWPLFELLEELREIGWLDPLVLVP